MRIVAALGGNALLERGETPDAEIQQHHVFLAANALAPLCSQHDLVITHGNGPQVGVLALESDNDPVLRHAYPLDVLGAQTQGMIGYWLLQSLENAVAHRQFAALVTQTVVDPDDRAFAQPSKFVGQGYRRSRAVQLAAERDWQIRRDGRAWRRVVPSPRPLEIVELTVIRRLVEQGIAVICSGGGGIPVVRDLHNQLQGIEAVIDKDHTAALLATELEADALLLLTDVGGVEIDYGSGTARVIHEATTSELRRLDLPDGSMGPKVEAACDFVDATGAIAAIGRLEQAEALLAGTAGTVVRPSRISS